MSPRERWIVYPLLFFSFGLAIRDQVPEWQPDPSFDTLTCRHLIVEDAQGGPAVDIHARHGGPHGGSGVVTVYSESPAVGTTKTPVVRLSMAGRRSDAQDRFGVVETFGPLGSPAARLVNDEGGGQIQFFNPIGKVRREVDPNDPRQAPVRPPMPEVNESDGKTEDGAADV